ncbi:MAG: hypothetical protein ACK58L_01330 [Planctomycetota bacterium]
MSIWLVLLAVGDAIASRVHISQAARSGLKSQQSLQAALDEMRQRQATQCDRDHEELTFFSRPQ